MLKQKSRYILYRCFLNFLSEATTQGVSVIPAANNKDHQYLPHAQPLSPQNNMRCFRQCSHCTAWLSGGPWPQYAIIPVQRMEQLLNSKHFPRNVWSILAYTNGMTGRSTPASSRENPCLPHGIQRPLHHRLWSLSISLHKTKAWAQPKFSWFLFSEVNAEQRASFSCRPPLTTSVASAEQW